MQRVLNVKSLRAPMPARRVAVKAQTTEAEKVSAEGFKLMRDGVKASCALEERV